MKLEKLFIGAAATAALVITTSAAPTGPGISGVSGSSPVITQVQSGTTTGSWNLPNGPTQPGAVVGTWFATGTAGSPQFLMAATLEETPIFPAPLSFVTGTMMGELKPFPLSPLPSKMKIVGTWTALTLSGEGSFQGYVVVEPPPGSLAPILLIGKFQGVFEDSWDIDAIGSHKGRWRLFF